MVISKKVIGVIVVLCAGMLPLTAALWSLIILQPQETKLFIDPPSIVYETLIKGERFSINITVANVTDLKSYELKLSFNTPMLGLVGIQLLPEENLPNGNFNVASGTLWMNVTYESAPITTDQPVALAVITFEIRNSGESPLHFYDTKLADSSGNLISHETADGMVVVQRHDVAIVEVAPSTTETYIGRIVNVTVVAKNIGDAPENFTVKVYHNDTLFDSFNVTNLAPGENTTITFNWDTNDVAAGHGYTLKAEASEVPFEANTTNNVHVDGEVKIKIIGDVNNDDTVDIEDLIAWDAAYGTSEGMPNWNPQADINGNGEVDKEDGILIIQNYP
jgi:hypothetical protein